MGKSTPKPAFAVVEMYEKKTLEVVEFCSKVGQGAKLPAKPKAANQRLGLPGPTLLRKFLLATRIAALGRT